MRSLITFSLLLLAFVVSGGNRVDSKSGSGLSADEQPRPELVLQTGHSKLVKAVVISPNDRWAASGSFDNTIKIWDFESGRELRSLSGHKGSVNALVCSPDGAQLASGGNDGTVRIWEVESGKEVSNSGVQEDSVEALAFSPDGRRVASAGSSNSITLRDVSTGQEIVRLKGHVDSIFALAFSPDGNLLASGSLDRTIMIWDLVKGKVVKTLKGHTDAINVLQFNATGDILASGSPDKTVRLWQVSSGRNAAVLSGHKGKVLALNFLSAEKLMSVDATRETKIWDMAGKKATVLETRQIDESEGSDGESAAYSLDGKFLAVGNGDGTISLNDAKSAEKLNKLENHTTGYYGVAFSKDRHWLVSAGFDNTVKLWDLQTGQSLSPLRGHTGRVTSVAFNPDNRRIISGSVDHTIRVWDAITSKSLETLIGHTDKVSSVAVGSKGKLVVSGSSDKTVGIWDLDAKDKPRFLTGHTGEVISVAISVDENFIASASMDQTVKIWSVQTGLVTRTIEPKEGEVDAVTFSPDGKFIASGGADAKVSIWELETGRLIREVAGHTGKVLAISFSPDGKQIATSSQDKSVRIWSVADGKQIYGLNGHVGAVFSISYSPDGQFLASASEDGSIIVSNATNGEQVSTLISLKNSNDWLVVTPSGFFDGSPSAWEQISWRFEKNSFNVKPVEVFFNEFYSPGVLADLLNKLKLPSTSNISNKDRRQPGLKLRLADVQPGARGSRREVKVNIDITLAPGGAKDVRLFRNGSLVKVWRGDVLKGQSAVTLNATLPVVAGPNRLTAYAFNADDVKSRDATLVVNGNDGVERKGIFYILSVGVNEYANAEYNLKQAVADAQDFAGEMQRQQNKLGSSERVEVTLLNDAEATKANILRSLADFSAKIQPEDRLTIFFAGHGTAQRNRFYLIPHDIGYEGSRTQLDPAGLQKILDHGISDEELDAALEGLDARQLLLVIDACNSGQALETQEKRRGPMNSKGLAQLAQEKGMFILTAAQSYQDAKEAVRLGHGYLTFALVEEGLKTGAADRQPKDGQVLLREWLDYATERVPQIDQEEIEKGGRIVRQLEREKSTGSVVVDARSIQRPRVFYRREIESNPIVVARP